MLLCKTLCCYPKELQDDNGGIQTHEHVLGDCSYDLLNLDTILCAEGSQGDSTAGAYMYQALSKYWASQTFTYPAPVF